MAYGPYVREIDIWCDLFPEVVIAGPGRRGEPDSDGLAFSRSNLSLSPIPESGGETLAAKLRQLIILPWVVAKLCFAMWRADAIHVRCPGNLGLLGTILSPIFSKRLIAKYAGQWNGFPNERWSVRLQRRLLKSRWWRGIVTVYGEWPDQPDHVIPFFTSVMTPEQIESAKRIAAMRRNEPVSIVFVGRLSREKNVDVLLQSVAALKQRGIEATCTIVGHGAEQENLQRLSADLEVNHLVHFAGGVDFDQVFDFYSRATVLVLASETEGWPKVIAEAMACGLVCVGSDRGLVPWMLSENRGFVVTPRDVDGLTDTLQQVFESPQMAQDVSEQAAMFGQQYSLESLKQALADLMSTRWETPVGSSPIDESSLNVAEQVPVP